MTTSNKLQSERVKQMFNRLSTNTVAVMSTPVACPPVDTLRAVDKQVPSRHFHLGQKFARDGEPVLVDKRL
ncbi:hypothetical protein RR48_03806 [Papilio machaon]|uniref:Uncharacterized protein n=1 Tax=Papilio machaon TaxID=76193 RepID=A0A0N0PB78_PAPMA|nr:hypothetical protein RR48_03806 [Papilio machaon]